MIYLFNPIILPLQVTSISLSTLAVIPKRAWRRVFNTEKVNGLTYYNTTKHEIIIEVTIQNAYPSAASINFTIDGLAFTQILHDSPNNGFGTRTTPYQKSIPPGKSYISNAAGMVDWMEFAVP